MALITKLNNIATAIGQKTGEPASTYTLDNMPSAIASIQTAWPVVPNPDTTKIVRFIDYDGTIVTQMTLDEAQELTSLPEIPTHEGLTGLKWTHTLATIQSASRSLNVGAVYQNAANPDQTIFFMLPRANEAVTLNFYQSVTNGVTIDWGDGSAAETVAGEGTVTATHTYATVDASSTPLKLTFTPDGGVDTALGWGTSGKNVFNNGNTNYSTVVGAILGHSEIRGNAFSGCVALTSIVIPDSVTSIGISAFYNCCALTSIVIPDSVTSIGDYAFSSCLVLSSIVIPDSVTSIGNSYTFQNCQNLSSIVIPSSTTGIGNYLFQNCYALASIAIPSSVTSIVSNAFSSCISISSIKFADRATMPTGQNWVFFATDHCPYIFDCSEFTQVPTVTANFLANMPAYTRILVPASLEADWKAAANWSTYASQIVGV